MMELIEIISREDSPNSYRDLEWSAKLLSKILNQEIRSSGPHPYCRGELYSVPGEHSNVYCVEFESLYLTIGKTISSSEINILIDDLTKCRTHFKQIGDVENSTKVKYLLNSLFLLNTYNFDALYAFKVTQTAQSIIKELISKLNVVLVDTDRLCISNSIDEISNQIGIASDNFKVKLKYQIRQVDVVCTTNPKKYSIKGL